MTHFKKSCLPSLIAVSALVLSACVTINIYFPAAAAEKAADKIIDDVWQLKDQNGQGENKGQPGDAGQSGQSADQGAKQ